jgi:hypothetical protein
MSSEDRRWRMRRRSCHAPVRQGGGDDTPDGVVATRGGQKL